MATEQTPVLDRAAFDEFAALFDAAELREMIEDWHADNEAALAAIAAALAREDGGRIGEIAHRATGGALALGAIRLARACERLRVAAESPTPVTAADVAPVRAAVEATHAAMTDAAARTR
jgi:HPt (histidine-containing phosphotransfer) domain-containing protein